MTRTLVRSLNNIENENKKKPVDDDEEKKKFYKFFLFISNFVWHSWLDSFSSLPSSRTVDTNEQERCSMNQNCRFFLSFTLMSFLLSFYKTQKVKSKRWWWSYKIVNITAHPEQASSAAQFLSFLLFILSYFCCCSAHFFCHLSSNLLLTQLHFTFKLCVENCMWHFEWCSYFHA